MRRGTKGQSLKSRETRRRVAIVARDHLGLYKETRQTWDDEVLRVKPKERKQ